MSEQRLWDVLEDALRPIARRSEEDAADVYRALCNTVWEDTGGRGVLSMSWRSAGALVADLRREGEDYMDFYCSGNEGTVTDEIRQTLENSGLRPLV